MKTPAWDRLTGFTMWHHMGMRAVERMLLDGSLPPRALLAFWTIATRVHPLTGKAWATGDELSAVYGMHPENFGRHISVLKKLGLMVRRKEKPVKKLKPWEVRSLPDPATRGPHSGRLFFQLHPLLVSVGSRSKRDRALDEFREAIGNRVTPFEEVLAAIEAEDREQELTAYIEQMTGGQATPAGMGTPAAA
jgi:DNA-binding transcriptional ArsR family regulator